MKFQVTLAFICCIGAGAGAGGLQVGGTARRKNPTRRLRRAALLAWGCHGLHLALGKDRDGGLAGRYSFLPFFARRPSGVPGCRCHWCMLQDGNGAAAMLSLAGVVPLFFCGAFDICSSSSEQAASRALRAAYGIQIPRVFSILLKPDLAVAAPLLLRCCSVAAPLLLRC